MRTTREWPALLAGFTMLAAVAAVYGQITLPPVELFHRDPDCGCVLPSESPRTLTPKEITVGESVWQVLYGKSSGREEFRIKIGTMEDGERVTYFHYGVVQERDLNGDGRIDFTWYGGDDAGEDFLLVLSEAGKYRIVDAGRSAGVAYAKQFGKEIPDLGAVGGEDRLELRMEIGKSPVLLASLVPVLPSRVTKQKNARVDFRIAAADWVEVAAR